MGFWQELKTIRKNLLSLDEQNQQLNVLREEVKELHCERKIEDINNKLTELDKSLKELGELYSEKMQEQNELYSEKMQEQTELYSEKMQEQNELYSGKMQEQNELYSEKMKEQEALLQKKIGKKQEKLLKQYFDDYYSMFKMSELDRQYRAGEAIEYLLKQDGIRTVLDIGSGAGVHSNIFADAGCMVTAIDYGKSPEYKENKNIKQIIADFNEYVFEEQYDCVWCCHVLEHQLNPGMFLKKVHSLVKEGGYLAITVPPLKQMIVGGHVTLWNAGLLLYHLVLAGFDCSEAAVKSYGYNVSVVVKKRSVDVMDRLCYDRGDLAAIREYLPNGLEYHETETDMPYKGMVKSLNWI